MDARAKNGVQRTLEDTTAKLALAAGVPGFLLTAYAAAQSNSLTIRADFALTLLDMLVLLTAWLVTRQKAASGSRKRSHFWGETFATGVSAFCMCVSMAVVGGCAIQRIAAGGVEPQGDGLVVGLALNVGYAAINLWVLLRWKARARVSTSALIRAQISLFSDKLSSNLLISTALGSTMLLQGTAAAGFIDPVAGLLLAMTTARWTVPVVRDTVKGVHIGLRRRSPRRTRNAPVALQSAEQTSTPA